jgi:hypothetical protein
MITSHQRSILKIQKLGEVIFLLPELFIFVQIFELYIVALSLYYQNFREKDIHKTIRCKLTKTRDNTKVFETVHHMS